jgi:hypothetical protein
MKTFDGSLENSRHGNGTILEKQMRDEIWTDADVLLLQTKKQDC